MDTVLGNWPCLSRAIGLDGIKRPLQTSPCIQLLFKFSWYMPCHPVYICNQQSENHFASCLLAVLPVEYQEPKVCCSTPCTASQRYPIPTSAGAQKCFSTEKLQRLGTENHKHGVYTVLHPGFRDRDSFVTLSWLNLVSDLRTTVGTSYVGPTAAAAVFYEMQLEKSKQWHIISTIA